MTQKPHQGWYSVLRWRSDSVRDEARNVALLLVDERGGFNAIRSAPLSRISSRLHEQGILDAALAGLEKQFDSGPKFTLERLETIHQQLNHSLYLTKPRPVAVDDLDATIRALYGAFIATSTGSPRQTKSALLDQVVTAYRHRGMDIRRGAYIEDFIFDAILLRGNKRAVVAVFSFGSPRKDWTPIERDAGHFLFALKQLDLPGTAVIREPSPTLSHAGHESHRRIVSWLKKARVSIKSPNEILSNR